MFKNFFVFKKLTNPKPDDQAPKEFVNKILTNKETYILDAINPKDGSIEYQVEYKFEKSPATLKLEDLEKGLIEIPRWLVVIGSLVLLFLILMFIITPALLLNMPRDGILNEDCTLRRCSSTLNLKCINKTCQCESKQYYTNKCYNLGSYQDNCFFTTHCDTTKSLACLYSKCSCINTKFWNSNTQSCVDRLTYAEKCSGDQCKLYSNLTCNLNTGVCECEQSSMQYWDGTSCVNKKTYSQTCANDIQCLDSQLTTCISLKCSCGINEYFEKYTSNCEDQLSEFEKCYSSIQCLTPMFCSAKFLCSCPKYQFHDASTLTCVNQYINGQSCTVSSQCRDDLGLACDNNMCSCSTPGQTWCSQLQKCVFNSGVNLDTCSYDCTCRDDLGLTCQTFSNGYGCYSSFSSKKCLCNSTNYWDGNSCVNKLSQDSICNSNCNCRQDLGLYCQLYSNGYDCYTSYTGSLCKCLFTHYWSSSSCVPKYFEQQTCSSNCECRMDLGLSCKLYSSIGYSCYTSFTGSKCLCNENFYWTGSSCQSKKMHDVLCNNNCECREDLGLTCQTISGKKVCRCDQTIEYWSLSRSICKLCANTFSSYNDYPYTCYKTTGLSQSFFVAKSTCDNATAGSFLVTPTTGVQLALIEKLQPSSNIWVNSYTTNTTLDYRWEDDTPVASSLFQRDQPNNAGGSVNNLVQDALRYESNKNGLNDWPSSGLAAVLCQYGS